MAQASFPRLVSEKQAAESVGLPPATFRSWVDCGRLPKPLPDCGLFDMKAIDAALDRVSGLGGSSNNALDAWRDKRSHAG